MLKGADPVVPGDLVTLGETARVAYTAGTGKPFWPG